MSLPAFTPDEISLSESTRSARLKWVIVVDGTVPLGRLANAVACVSASVGSAIEGIIGPSAADAAGIAHAGLPWAGCTVLTASLEQLEDIRVKAAGNENMFIADMPASAQTNRVYTEWMSEMARTADPMTMALGLVGPRNAVDRLVKRLSLL